MRGLAATAALLAGLALAGTAHAQSPDPARATRLEMEARQRRHVVRPPVSPEQAARDVESAAGEIDRPARTDRLMRELTRPPHRRPDQDFDVRQGIQAEGIRRVLRR